MKNIRTWVTLLGLVLLGYWLFNDWSSSDPEQHQGVVVDSWYSAIGPEGDKVTDMDKQKFSYWGTVWNDSTQETFITQVKMELPDSLRKHVLSGDTVIFVNQSLSPNGTHQFKGELILDTKGMTKQDVVNLGNIKGFTVETR
ncbi:hypothetical protein ACQCN2_17030 [Brevibacillus ginsengisoli]|uniref:hypothetical protein n=1 Tax=Brevibacillus ginsengisoli TaxID=363854 RepID=UPI003CECB0CD